MKPCENFAVAVTAQEVEAVTINADVESCGLHVSSGRSKNGISAIQALKVVHGMRDPADGLLRKTLTTVLGAWGSDPTSWDGMMLRAVAIVIHRNWDTIALPSPSLTLKQEPVGVWKERSTVSKMGNTLARVRPECHRSAIGGRVPPQGGDGGRAVARGYRPGGGRSASRGPAGGA